MIMNLQTEIIAALSQHYQDKVMQVRKDFRLSLVQPAAGLAILLDHGAQGCTQSGLENL